MSILISIQQDVQSFLDWAYVNHTDEQLARGIIDSPGFPYWNRIEEHLEEAFQTLDFETVNDAFKEHLLFLIHHQWDIGHILNWFDKGDGAIGALGMTAAQLEQVGHWGLTSQWVDARAQLAASLYKSNDKNKAVALLLRYHQDEDEYVRRMALQALHRLNYPQLNSLLLQSWSFDETYERMLCLQIWKASFPAFFTYYCLLAEADDRTTLRDYALSLKTSE